MSSTDAISKTTLALHPDDNVVVALVDVAAGEIIRGTKIEEDIHAGHKFANQSIDVGQDVIKYGFPIGRATQRISTGQRVHDHNLQTALGDARFTAWSEPSDTVVRQAAAQVSCFAAPHNRTAIRNEIWIVNTVACVNQTAARLAERATRELSSEHPGLDGFFAFPHPYGCSQLGDDLSSTQQILAGLVNHPHAGGVLILGLGCESNRMVDQLGAVDSRRMANIAYFNTQEVPDEMEHGMKALRRLAAQASDRRRDMLPASRLILGMKCGGSDGLSGITANPLLGRVADRHCGCGGTVMLTEVPEMFGAEPLLLARCDNENVHRELIEMVNQFKDYFRRHGQPISENPSPGNRDGGLTTLEEKSLGCVQKAGTQARIKQIVPYGAQATPELGGIALLNGPGNDGVSITALTAAGANVILFSTGRGTPMGAPVPTIKVATNSQLAGAKPSWIDFDAGRLLTSPSGLDDLAGELYDLILDVSRGDVLAKNETNGYREIAIWKTGVTL